MALEGLLEGAGSNARRTRGFAAGTRKAEISGPQQSAADSTESGEPGQNQQNAGGFRNATDELNAIIVQICGVVTILHSAESVENAIAIPGHIGSATGAIVAAE